MSTRTATRRRQQRHSVAIETGAFVEFEYPRPNGQNYRLQLVDLSSSGLSFKGSIDDLPPCEAGTSLDGAVIRIQECMIRGDLMLMHVTQRPDGDMLCGALLYPGSDDDLLKLKAVLAGMEAVRPD